MCLQIKLVAELKGAKMGKNVTNNYISGSAEKFFSLSHKFFSKPLDI
jgi:tyrosyl-tRNA synthetase